MGRENIYTFIDLFAGAGGLSEGFIRAGFMPIAHIEMNKDACNTLKTRSAYHYLKNKGELYVYENYLKNKQEGTDGSNLWKLVPNTVTDSVICEAIGEQTINNLFSIVDKLKSGENVDIIIGGPPCQAYSVAGRARMGKDVEQDPRNELYKYYVKFIDKYRRDYYETLQGVSRYNDWDSWIEFFLRALREQAKLLKFRVDQVNDLYMKYHSQIDNFSSKYAPLFLDAIFQKQTITASNILDMTRIPAASVYILIEKFVEKGVIKETGLTSRRQRQYNFTELTKIVEGLKDPS